MVTKKKQTIKTNVFEKKMIGLIKMAKALDMPDKSRKVLLEELRHVHNSCMEWAEPQDQFRILEELRI